MQKESDRKRTARTIDLRRGIDRGRGQIEGKMLLQGLLIVGALGLLGCNVVLPTQPPSQIWPRYVEQKAQFDYAASHGCIKLPRLPTPGQPMSDHRQDI